MTKDNVYQLSSKQTTVFLSDLAIDDTLRMFPMYERDDIKLIVDFLVDQGYMFDEPLDGDLVLEVDEEMFEELTTTDSDDV